MENRTTHAGINASARSTYQWYLDSFRWLGIAAPSEEEEIQKHLEALESILNSVPEM